MNGGLAAADDKKHGMGVRGGNKSSSSKFLETIDSSTCVKNLCAAQMFHPQDFCNIDMQSVDAFWDLHSEIVDRHQTLDKTFSMC